MLLARLAAKPTIRAEGGKRISWLIGPYGEVLQLSMSNAQPASPRWLWVYPGVSRGCILSTYIRRACATREASIVRGSARQVQGKRVSPPQHQQVLFQGSRFCGFPRIWRLPIPSKPLWRVFWLVVSMAGRVPPRSIPRWTGTWE